MRWKNKNPDLMIWEKRKMINLKEKKEKLTVGLVSTKAVEEARIFAAKLVRLKVGVQCGVKRARLDLLSWLGRNADERLLRIAEAMASFSVCLWAERVGVNELYEIDGKKKEGIIIWDTQVYKKNREWLS